MDTLHLPSSRQAAAIASGIALDRTDVVHDGLGDAVRGAEVSAGIPVVGLVGRIAPWKGQHVFLDAATIVRKRFPEVRYQIVGAPLFGEYDYEQRVRRQCAELGLDDVVEFTGFREDVADLIARFTVLVHASTVPEPFGQVVLEGMMAGKPVVATRGGGVTEIVVEGETGLLVPMGDADAMAAAIMELLEDHHRARGMGEAGRRRALSEFTIDRTARQVEAIYERLLGDR
jgi:glycosyltransferase involved in cell wall biosynthesis